MRLILVVLLLLWGTARPALAQTAEADYRRVFSLEALGHPRPSAGLATSFSLAYRGLVPNAAFAVARDAAGRSAWGFAGGAATPPQAEAAALDRCRATLHGLQAECRVVLRNLEVAGAAVQPLAAGSLGPFRWSPLHLRRGPQAAKGVVIWAHGYAGADRDLRSAAPGFVSILNDAGWDVLRFDRNPGDDALFTSLPRLVDAVMATAPAAHGEASRANNLLAGLDDFRRLLAGLPATGPRLAVVLFDGDDFDPDTERRAAMLEALARDRRVPTLALWPQGPGSTPIRTYGGAGDWRFTTLYGACLLTLVEAPEAAVPRGLRRAACGGG